jgi:16S rRNA C1402 (ribose-2'-O) methylase RsmI
MTVKTQEQVVCLYEHHDRNEHTIDSLSTVIKNMRKVSTRRVSVVYDTVYVAADPD